MTGIEVLSDLIKIGVPSLLTGTTAFLIARTSRSHDLEKERRRRKQDFLERVAEALDDLEIRLSDVHVGAHEKKSSVLEPGQEPIVKSGDIDAAEVAARRMSNMKTRLVMLGFADCVDQYDRFMRAVNLFYDQVARYENDVHAEMGKALDECQAEAEKLRTILAAAYASL